MGTKGKALRRRDGFLIRLGDELVPLHELAERIQTHEALTGRPVEVTLDPPVPEHVQRLYATLGVAVRFRPVPRPGGGSPCV